MERYLAKNHLNGGEYVPPRRPITVIEFPASITAAEEAGTSKGNRGGRNRRGTMVDVQIDPNPLEVPPPHGRRGSSRGKRADCRGKKGMVQKQTTRKAPPTGRAGNPSKKPPPGRRATAVISSASRKVKSSASSAEATPVTTVTTAPTNHAEDIAVEAKEAPARVPLLSMAGRVVAEYEMLLDAVPTLARQMGRLQEDTETMAEGLETRVRNLVEGYRELNGLVEQAPAIVSNAASEYARTLSGRPPGVLPSATVNGNDNGEQEQALDVERIHAELFSLREAKIALDNAVKLTPDFRSGDELRKAGKMRRSVSTMTCGVEKESPGLAREIYPLPSSAAWRNAGRLPGSDTRSTRPNNRRALMEVQVDPDLPLPLPVFPGYGRLFRSERRSDRKPLPGPRISAVPNSGSSDPVPAGAPVIPRQRQSYCLPPELRAISTAPKLGAGIRIRARPRVPTRSDGGTPLAPNSRSQKRGYLPAAPGSAAAAAAAREQRRQTILAVEELRKEMHEREERLEKELERLKTVRLRRAARSGGVGGGFSGSLANKRRSLPTANLGRRRSNIVESSKRSLESKKTVVTRVLNGNGTQTEGVEKRALGGDSCGVGAAASTVEKVDAEAQTAADGVQVFLPPRPTVRAALLYEGSEKRDRVVETPGVTSKGVGRGDDSSFASSSSSLTGEKNRHVFPPPPVVYLEGEGRNASWKPRDDDRLLTTRGDSCSRRAAALSGGRNNAHARVDRDSEGSYGKQGSRVVSATVADDSDVVIGGDSCKRELQREELVTAGMLLGAVSESPADLEKNGDDRWADLEGMLALSAADNAAEARARGQRETSPKGEGREASPEGEGGEMSPGGERREKSPGEEVEAVTPELIGLMREVVQQQRGLGEERSALMQALRAEVEGRRILLAQQEISLRQREFALEKRESEVWSRQREAMDAESRKEGAEAIGLIGPSSSGGWFRPIGSRGREDPMPGVAIAQVDRVGDDEVKGDERDRTGEVDEGLPRDNNGYYRNGTCWAQEEEVKGGEGSESGSPDDTAEHGEYVRRANGSNDGESAIGERDQPSQAEGAEIRGEHPLMPATASSAGNQEREGRLHLSLATAVLSVARRICDMDDRTSVRLEGAQGLARRAIEEARKEGEDVRRRQSEVIQRLEEMEQGSRERAGFVERDISKLRVEGRLTMEKTQARQAIVLHPQHVYDTNALAPHSTSTELDEISELDASSPRGLLLPVPAPPLLSASRSSMSEGQLRGSFSDGEMVRLTPRGRNAIEDGVILPATSTPPLQTHLTVLNHSGTSNSPDLGLRTSDPRKHLKVLMAANPGLGHRGRRAVAESLPVASGWGSSTIFREDYGPEKFGGVVGEARTGKRFPSLSEGEGSREPGQVDGPPSSVDGARDLVAETATPDTGSCGAADSSSSSNGAELGVEFHSASVLEASSRGEEGGDGNRLRPPVPLRVIAGAVASERRSRNSFSSWRKTHYGRACAEAGLDLSTSYPPNTRSADSCTSESKDEDSLGRHESKDDFDSSLDTFSRGAKLEPGE